MFSYISKFLVVFCAMITNGLDPASQGALLILMMLGVFLVQEKLRPYKYGFVNDLFTSSYIVTICTASFAIMSSARNLTDSQRNIYMVVLIGINLLFYIVWTYYFIREGADWEASRSFMKDYIKRVSQNVSQRLSKVRLSQSSRRFLPALLVHMKASTSTGGRYENITICASLGNSVTSNFFMATISRNIAREWSSD